MPHDDGRGVAREASRRSRGNAETLHPFQRRLSGSPIDPVGTVGLVLLLLRQHTLVHVHDHLVAVARCPWVQIGRQRALRHQTQRVGAPLASGGLKAVFPRLGFSRLLAQAVGRRFQRAPHHGPHLG